VDYLDVLDAEGVPAERRILAALGPRVLRLAAARTAGAHSYLVTPEHSRPARFSAQANSWHPSSALSWKRTRPAHGLSAVRR
jgi:hypothetical protein